MIVLDKNKRLLAGNFVDDRFGEFFVDRFGVKPIGLFKSRLIVDNVAERPEGFVGKAVIVAGLFRFVKPDPAKGIFWIFGRDPNLVFFINHLAIGIAAP